jgi:hypothetical protein
VSGKKRKTFPALTRSAIVSVRFSPSELSTLDRLATRLGVARAALLRQVFCDFMSRVEKEGLGNVAS